MAITPLIQRENKMDKLSIYLVHDIKAGTYGAPLFFDNNVEALRSLEQAVKDPNTSLSKFPSDYNLLHTGTFDRITGQITPAEHSVLANCSSFLQ